MKCSIIVDGMVLALMILSASLINIFTDRRNSESNCYLAVLVYCNIANHWDIQHNEILIISNATSTVRSIYG